MYAELSITSNFTFLTGASHPEEYMERAVTLDLPVVQVRGVAAGETVGYGNAFLAPGPMRIATVCGGSADGLIRAMGPDARECLRRDHHALHE